MDLTSRRVLVTGAGGFIGSHLVEALIDHGCRVRAFVHYNSSNSSGWLDTFPPELVQGLEVFAGDVRDPNGVLEALQGCDVVFHLAALIGIPFSYRSPDSYVDTNIRGTLNILQAARRLRTPRIIITSTSEVYGTAKYVPIDENHPLQAQSPYSASKIGADRLAESFFRSFELPLVIARPFNTYGPRQSARAVIPTIITQLLAGARQLRLGKLTPTRDFNFVKDIAQAYIAIASSENVVGQEINIATGAEISIADLAQLVMQEMAIDAQVALDADRLRPENSEVERLLGDNRKVLALTNWFPQFDLQGGLRQTIQWYRNPEMLRRFKSEIYNV